MPSDQARRQELMLYGPLTRGFDYVRSDAREDVDDAELRTTHASCLMRSRISERGNGELVRVGASEPPSMLKPIATGGAL
jgi:hypothetical protein